MFHLYVAQQKTLNHVLESSLQIEKKYYNYNYFYNNYYKNMFWTFYCLGMFCTHKTQKVAQKRKENMYVINVSYSHTNAAHECLYVTFGTCQLVFGQAVNSLILNN